MHSLQYVLMSPLQKGGGRPLTTKIGLLSDVHADVMSLRAALDVLESNEAGEILCAGDLVEKGPEGDAVIRLLQDEKTPTVMGNHDHYAMTHLAQLVDAQGKAEHGLIDASITFLEKLPNYLQFEREGKRLFLAHGTPYDKYEYLFLNSPVALYQLVLEETDYADVIILGHTHAPMIVRIEDSYIVNPGSVCRTFSFGSGTCAILTLPDMVFDVYDVQTGKLVGAEKRLVENIA